MRTLDDGISLPDHAAEHWFRAPYELQHRLESERKACCMSNSLFTIRLMYVHHQSWLDYKELLSGT